eukprot:jgi/Mesvir1/24415/Mv11079-RA.1
MAVEVASSNNNNNNNGPVIAMVAPAPPAGPRPGSARVGASPLVNRMSMATGTSLLMMGGEVVQPHPPPAHQPQATSPRGAGGAKPAAVSPGDAPANGRAARYSMPNEEDFARAVQARMRHPAWVSSTGPSSSPTSRSPQAGRRPMSAMPNRFGDEPSGRSGTPSQIKRALSNAREATGSTASPSGGPMTDGSTSGRNSAFSGVRRRTTPGGPAAASTGTRLGAGGNAGASPSPAARQAAAMNRLETKFASIMAATLREQQLNEAVRANGGGGPGGGRAGGWSGAATARDNGPRIAAGGAQGPVESLKRMARTTSQYGSVKIYYARPGGTPAEATTTTTTAPAAAPAPSSRQPPSAAHRVLAGRVITGRGAEALAQNARPPSMSPRGVPGGAAAGGGGGAGAAASRYGRAAVVTGSGAMAVSVLSGGWDVAGGPYAPGGRPGVRTWSRPEGTGV